MYLHFAHDNIFLDNFIKLVSNVQDTAKHRFIVYSFDINRPIAKDSRIERINVESVPELLNISGETNGIFLHCFSSKILTALAGLRKEIPLYWLYWGNELTYPNDYYTGMLFGKETKRLFFSAKNNKFRHFPHPLPGTAAGIYKYFDKGYRITQKAMGKINYFCHYNIFDFEGYRNKYFHRAEFKPFFYPFDEDYFTGLSDLNRDTTGGNRILIGNSGNYANNHLEAFRYIRNSSLSDYNIICPLSYGDEGYIGTITEEGRRIFGNKFMPVNNFLSAVEYRKLLSGCSAVIMNHLRSEAAGAVITSLYLGKKVYMNPVNNLYRFLKSLGIYLFDVTECKLDDSVFTGLTEEQVRNNREIILGNFSFSRSTEFLRNILLN